MNDADGTGPRLSNATDVQRLVALEYFAARKSNFATEQELRSQMQDTLPADVELDSVLAQFRDPAVVRAATRFAVDELLKDPSSRAILEEGARQAESKLSGLEPILLTLLIMYGVHYVVTGGKASERRVKKGPDGSSEETVISYGWPAGWLGDLVGLFRAGSGMAQLPQPPEEMPEITPGEEGDGDTAAQEGVPNA
ncbi:hypothetical protein [Microbacterium trichothecenolyticum]|uniref:Uncharacterized protein n=1 Tax=Microbacterium trichothecenolyticum TaxID=69370 RepID=A0A0M2HEE9_MICTR|nr:hypothetical protein [Microbacterium trichothecenolyticum]KJL45014.1 hypothetical protein RS82_00524 [Microbacterium trichothecenolyticum]